MVSDVDGDYDLDLVILKTIAGAARFRGMKTQLIGVLPRTLLTRSFLHLLLNSHPLAKLFLPQMYLELPFSFGIFRLFGFREYQKHGSILLPGFSGWSREWNFSY